MKQFISTIFIFFISLLCVIAQQSKVVGSWYGATKINGKQLRIVFNIEQSKDSLKATMDSPDQKASGIPVQSVQFKDSTLLIQVPLISLTFKGTLTRTDSIKGNILQRMALIPISLSRNKIEAQRRAQEPSEPYPYGVEELLFENKKDSVTLAGTLTLPKNSQKCAAVILVSGSGAQDRDESILGHRPFLVIADYLSRNGIAVLRYDDRGFGGSSGDFAAATTYDFANDAAAAVNYLRSRSEIDPDKIGIIGHSEGGMVAPLVAKDDSRLNFIVLLASPGVPGDSLLLMQNYTIGRASGVIEELLVSFRNTNRHIYDMVKNGDSTAAIMQYMQSNPLIKESQARESIKQLTSAWFQTFIKHDPSVVLENIKCRVLALNGTKDLQVPYVENLSAIERALIKGENNNFKTEALEGLNHLFQSCESGLPTEYGTIEQTISPTVLQNIVEWINK